MKKSYYAIIPANVRYDEDLPPNAKLLYGEITALCNEKGYCWANNHYFAELYNVKKETVSRWISTLSNKGYIKLELIYNDGSKQVKDRHIFINHEGGIDKKINTPCENNHEGIDKKVKDNTTSFNNTFNNNIPYLEIIDYLNEKADKRFKHTTAANQKFIRSRWNEGNTLDDFKRVIDIKVSQWKNDKDMNQYLRPQTLFGTKFESYLNEKPINKPVAQQAPKEWSGEY